MLTPTRTVGTPPGNGITQQHNLVGAALGDRPCSPSGPRRLSATGPPTSNRITESHGPPRRLFAPPPRRLTPATSAPRAAPAPVCEGGGPPLAQDELLPFVNGACAASPDTRALWDSLTSGYRKPSTGWSRPADAPAHALCDFANATEASAARVRRTQQTCGEPSVARSQYCALRGGSARDPSRREAVFLSRFLREFRPAPARAA